MFIGALSTTVLGCMKEPSDILVNIRGKIELKCTSTTPGYWTGNSLSNAECVEDETIKKCTIENVKEDLNNVSIYMTLISFASNLCAKECIFNIFVMTNQQNHTAAGEYYIYMYIDHYCIVYIKSILI